MSVLPFRAYFRRRAGGRRAARPGPPQDMLRGPARWCPSPRPSRRPAQPAAPWRRRRPVRLLAIARLAIGAVAGVVAGALLQWRLKQVQKQQSMTSTALPLGVLCDRKEKRTMTNSFDAAGFVKDIGRELVHAFETARKATTSELVGDAMETPVRERLEQVLPQGIGVGSGCVIDTQGNTSRQLDVVLYEKGICPVFCVNNSPETTYYPCEGVLAVGEVKSAIDKEKLGDAFRKIASVKALKRAYRTAWDEEVCGRPYGENNASISYGFARDYTNKGDIFGFIVAGESRVTVAPPTPDHRNSTLLDHYVENVNALGHDTECPDILALLDGTMLVPAVKNAQGNENQELRAYTPSRHKRALPHLVLACGIESPFGELLKLIWGRYRDGLTATIPLESYLGGAATRLRHMRANVAHGPSQEEIVGKADWLAELETPTAHIRNDITPLHSSRG